MGRIGVQISKSWKFDIVSFNRKLLPDEQELFRLKFEPFMPFEGPVKMRNPDYIFSCVLHYRKQVDEIQHIYLGRLVAEGQRNTNDRYDLKKRHYIGPTSTCAELSFLMSNQIQTRPGSLVWDCFVGTGSTLIAATVHGGICLGSDIDLRILNGLKKGKKAGSIQQNFIQYDLRQPDLVRMDLSSLPIRFKPLQKMEDILNIDLMELFVILLMVFVQELGEQRRTVLTSGYLQEGR